jgi:ABC-type bacteriocin/lantibiotic exporter with double-glycine peptidase domain
MVLKNFPIIQQLRDYDCGVAALQSVVLFYGLHYKYSDLQEMLKTTEDGTTPEMMKKALDLIGIRYTPISQDLEMIRVGLEGGYPAMILIQHDRDMYTTWEEEYKYGHWVNVIGMTKRSIIMADPGSGKELRLISRDFVKRWHDRGFEQYAIVTQGVS